MGVSIHFESQHVDLWAIYAMEGDDDVLEYYDQSARIPLRYRAKSGRNTTQWHTPDFFVIRQDHGRWMDHERVRLFLWEHDVRMQEPHLPGSRQASTPIRPLLWSGRIWFAEPVDNLIHLRPELGETLILEISSFEQTDLPKRCMNVAILACLTVWLIVAIGPSERMRPRFNSSETPSGLWRGTIFSSLLFSFTFGGALSSEWISVSSSLDISIIDNP